jgi:kynurenine formamidase
MDAPSHFLNVASSDQIEVGRIVCNAPVVKIDKQQDASTIIMNLRGNGTTSTNIIRSQVLKQH